MADLVLVGAPGSGKTTVGAIVARELKMPFHDTDEAIAAAASMPVGELLITSGEDRFRAVEAETALRLLAMPGVVALGAGSVLAAEVAAALRGMPVVWLRVDAKTSARRTGISGPHSQLMGPVRQVWTQLLDERDQRYQPLARWTVDTSGLADSQAAAAILGLMGTDHD